VKHFVPTTNEPSNAMGADYRIMSSAELIIDNRLDTNHQVIPPQRLPAGRWQQSFMTKTLQLFFGILMMGLTSYGQHYLGYYQVLEKVAVRGDGSFVYVSTSINLKIDSKFEYIFTGCDTFADSAVGTFLIKENMIVLSYSTPNSYDSYKIDTVWQKSDNNQISNFKIDTIHHQALDLSCSFRPNVLKNHRRKLIIVSYQDPSTENNNLKRKLKRINEKEWDESRMQYKKLIQNIKNGIY